MNTNKNSIWYLVFGINADTYGINYADYTDLLFTTEPPRTKFPRQKNAGQAATAYLVRGKQRKWPRIPKAQVNTNELPTLNIEL
jgi:hypothetical protein